MSDVESTNLSSPWSIRRPIVCGLIGAAVLGLIGCGYAAWLYYSPEYREAYIRETLSQPHMDSQRYLASVIAWRYRTLGSLLLQYGPTAAISGLSIGIFVGLVLNENRATTDTKRPSPFSLIETTAVVGIVGVLLTFLMPRNYGLVYYEGKDQFHWLQQLANGQEQEQQEAVKALCEILQKPAFPCRTTIIPSLAKAGPLAEPALPLLEKLTHDEDTAVAEAAREALAEIRKETSATQ